MDSSRRAILDSLVPRAIVPMPSAGIQLKLPKSHSGTIAFVIFPKHDFHRRVMKFCILAPQKAYCVELVGGWGE